MSDTSAWWQSKIMSLVGIVTGILAIYGRVTANTQIGSSK
jgi:hypothetical protein